MDTGNILASLKKYFTSHSKVREYPAHSSKVHTVDWSCDGKRLGSGSFDKSVTVFTLDRDRLSKEHSYRGHADSVDQLCWHPSHPDLFITASGDKTIKFWDVRSSKTVATVPTKGENINLAWSPDSKTVAVGNKEDLITFVDVKSRKVGKEEQFKMEVNEFSWSTEGDLMYITSGQGTTHVFSYPSLETLTLLQGHPANCICIAIDKTGKYIATGSVDALTSLWDTSDFLCARTLDRLEWPVRALSFSFDGKMLATGSEDLFIDIAHVETGEKITEILCESPTFAVAWHPHRYLLAFSCDDKDKYERERDAGNVKLYGIANE